jgi:DNA helicase HerA-like ATPase
MWLLADLFEDLPEVGDLDQPKLVFFFDEAHLLFSGASKAFLTAITQTVRLIRSKGVGIFFVTQTPKGRPLRRPRPARQPRPARPPRLHP